MDAIDAWDLAIFGLAGYVAVTALVRLMLGRRNALADELRQELELQRRRTERDKKKQQSAAQPAARGGRPAALKSSP